MDEVLAIALRRQPAVSAASGEGLYDTLTH
jgi:hypothetical protein